MSISAEGKQRGLDSLLQKVEIHSQEQGPEPSYFGMAKTITGTAADPNSEILFVLEPYALKPDYSSHKAHVVPPQIRGEGYTRRWRPGVLGFIEPLSGVWGVNPYLNTDWETWQATVSHESTHYSNQVVHNKPMIDEEQRTYKSEAVWGAYWN